MSAVVFLAPVRDTTTPTTIYARDEAATIADEAMVRAFQREGKCALQGADIRGIQAVSIATTSASIVFAVDQACTAMKGDYGTTTGYGSSQPATPAAGAGAIVVNLAGLTTNTLYHVRISVTVGSYVTLSPDFTFRTL